MGGFCKAVQPAQLVRTPSKHLCASRGGTFTAMGRQRPTNVHWQGVHIGDEKSHTQASERESFIALPRIPTAPFAGTAIDVCRAGTYSLQPSSSLPATS